MLKRIISLIIALIFAVMPLSSCFSEEPNESEPHQSSAAETTEYAPPKEESEIMLNGNIPCGYTALRYGFDETGDICSQALNYTGEDQEYYTPWLFKAESSEELKEIFELTRHPSGLNTFQDDGSDEAYNSLYGGYTDDFFADNVLIVIYRAAGSGGDVFDISGINAENGCLTVNIAQTQAGVTEDMSGWLFRISIPKDALEGITTYVAK